MLRLGAFGLSTLILTVVFFVLRVKKAYEEATGAKLVNGTILWVAPLMSGVACILSSLIGLACFVGVALLMFRPTISDSFYDEQIVLLKKLGYMVITSGVCMVICAIGYKSSGWDIAINLAFHGIAALMCFFPYHANSVAKKTIAWLKD